MTRGRPGHARGGLPHHTANAQGQALSTPRRAARTAAYLRALAAALAPRRPQAPTVPMRWLRPLAGFDAAQRLDLLGALRERHAHWRSALEHLDSARTAVHNTRLLLRDAQGREAWTTLGWRDTGAAPGTSEEARAEAPFEGRFYLRLVWLLNVHTDRRDGMGPPSAAVLLEVAEALEALYELPAQPALWTANELSPRNGAVVLAVDRLRAWHQALPAQAAADLTGPLAPRWQLWPPELPPVSVSGLRFDRGAPPWPSGQAHTWLTPVHARWACLSGARPGTGALAQLPRPLLLGLRLRTAPEAPFWQLHQWWHWHPATGLRALSVDEWPEASAQM